MSFHEAFGVDGYRIILKDKLGFGEADATMACDILLESAPVLVQKNVITLNQAFDPSEWQACAAFIAAGIRRVAASGGAGGKKDDVTFQNAFSQSTGTAPATSTIQDAAAAAAAAASAASAVATPASSDNDDDKLTLTNLIRVFRSDCVEFFVSLRKFMMAAATPLNARVQLARQASIAAATTAAAAAAAAKSSKAAANGGGGGGGGQGAGAESAGGGGVSVITGTVSNSGEGLDDLERALSVNEIRTSLTFIQAMAKKYNAFLQLHFHQTEPGGEGLALFGWRLYLVAMHTMLPKFPDLFSCYHLLVVVQAFLLVNAPRCLLCTSLANMMSMSSKDENGDVDALASLALSTQTSMSSLGPMLADFQNQVVQQVLATEMAKLSAAKETLTENPGGGKTAAAATLKPSEMPVDGLSRSGPLRYPDLFPEKAEGECAAEMASSAERLVAAAELMGRAYADSVADLGHLRFDERLFITFGAAAEDEDEDVALLGDLHPRANTKSRNDLVSTPWRGVGTMPSLLGPSPSRLGHSAAYSPYPGGASGNGGGGQGKTVPFTPVSEAIASASWLHTIVSSADASQSGGDGEDRINIRLTRFISHAMANELMDSVREQAGKTTAALREDVFLVTVHGAVRAGSEPNLSLESLVKRREEEAVQVFAHFLERILEREHKHIEHRQKTVHGGQSGGVAALGGAKGMSGGFGSVADIAALAAEQTGGPRPSHPNLTNEQRRVYEGLVRSSRFVRSILACSMEVVMASYRTATLKFPAIPHLLGLDAFDVCNIIEPFVRADTTMPRELKRHFNDIEESIMETIAWSKGSTLFGFLKAAEKGIPPPRPAAVALKAVSNDRGAGSGGNADASIKRQRGFSVAAVADAAADEPSCSGREDRDDSSEKRGAEDFDTSPPRGPGEKITAFAAFSTPLRGAMTPAHPGAGQRGYDNRISSSGVDPAPLTKRFVRNAVIGDLSARNSLRVFFAKVMRMSARRLADLCERVNLPYLVPAQAYSLVEHALYEHTSLLFNRHLDQILLCAVYGVCKITKEGELKGRNVPFCDLIKHYREQPQYREEIFWTVVISQTDPELEVTHQGDIIQFYNKVFVPELKPFLLSLRPSPKPQPSPSPAATSEGGSHSTTTPPQSGTNGTPIATQKLDVLYSPRKIQSVKQNVSVSPMRRDKAAAAAHMTPMSKSLFALMGESTHADQSPGLDLSVINRRVIRSANDAELEAAKRSHEGADVAGGAGAPGFGDSARLPPPGARNVRSRPSDDHADANGKHSTKRRR